jgi:hypothetical protein
MNKTTESKPVIVTEIIRRYYVEIDGWVYGGPFETIEEAKECRANAKKDPQLR